MKKLIVIVLFVAMVGIVGKSDYKTKMVESGEWRVCPIQTVNEDRQTETVEYEVEMPNGEVHIYVENGEEKRGNKVVFDTHDSDDYRDWSII